MSLNWLSHSRTQSASEGRLVEVLDEYLAAVQEGRAPTRAEFLARHPEMVDDLEACLASLEFIERASLTANALVDESSKLEMRGGATEIGKLGDFQLLREVGRGGMGVVYEADQLSLHRRVALKMLPFAAALDPQQLRRFQIEAQAAAQLHHTNIVPIFLVGCEQGVHYYAMQYIEGQTLAKLINDFKGQASRAEPTASDYTPHLTLPFNRGESGAGSSDFQLQTPTSATPIAPNIHTPAFFETVAHLGQQAAEGLEHAHQLGIIHRDIKPSNLLIDIRGNLWITDFGLARIQSDSTLTMSGDVLGTLRYMSPEQSSGVKTQIDHRADIYSLGATLYELLTLHPVHQSQDRADLIRRMTVEDPIAPRKYNPSIPKDLETIIQKALSKDADQRYQTAQSLADDLRRFQEHRPIQARRPNLWKRTEKWVKRHKALVTASVIMSMGAAAASLIIATLASRNHHLNQIARQDQYVKDIRQAFHLVHSNEKKRATDILTRHIPASGQQDQRSFPWYNLWQACHDPSRILARHEGDVYHVEFAPNGQTLASAGKDGTARIWDTASGEPIHVLRGHIGDVNYVTYSPDGQTLATGGDDGMVRLWNTADGQHLSTLGKHQDWITCILFTPDGHRLITSDHGGGAKIWDLKTGIEQATLPKHPGIIDFMALSPDGKTLATCGTLRAAKLWDLDQRREIRSLAALRAGSSVSFSHDGKKLATAGDGTEVKTWNVATGQLETTGSGHSLSPLCLAFSPDDRTLASAGWDDQIRVWDAETGRLNKTYHNRGSRCWSLAFSPDGRSLITSSADGRIDQWNLDTTQGHETIRIRVNGFFLDASWQGSTFQFLMRDPFDLNTFSLDSYQSTTRRYQPGTKATAPGIIESGIISTDAKRLAISDRTGSLTFWRAGSVDHENAFVLERRTNHVPGISPSRFAYNPCFSHNDQWFALSFPDTGSILVDTATGRLLPLPDARNLRAQMFFPCDDIFCASDDEHRIVTWDIPSRTLRISTDKIEPGQNISSFQQGGQRFATHAGNKIELWDFGSLQRQATLIGHASLVTATAFSPDGGVLASGDERGTLKLWDLASRQEMASFDCETGAIHNVWFSSDGSTVVSLANSSLITAQERVEITFWPTSLATSPTIERSSPGRTPNSTP